MSEYQLRINGVPQESIIKTILDITTYRVMVLNSEPSDSKPIVRDGRAVVNQPIAFMKTIVIDGTVYIGKYSVQPLMVPEPNPVLIQNGVIQFRVTQIIASPPKIQVTGYCLDDSAIWAFRKYWQELNWHYREQPQRPYYLGLPIQEKTYETTESSFEQVLRAFYLETFGEDGQRYPPLERVTLENELGIWILKENGFIHLIYIELVINSKSLAVRAWTGPQENYETKALLELCNLMFGFFDKLLGLPTSLPKLKLGEGELPPLVKPPKTQAEKLAAINRWDSTPENERPPFETWICENIGTTEDGTALFSENTVHGWRRYRNSDPSQT